MGEPVQKPILYGGRFVGLGGVQSDAWLGSAGARLRRLNQLKYGARVA